MGMPSMGIYSYELYKFFGVENIIRIGSAGALADNVRVRDVVIGIGASTNGNYQSQYKLVGSLSAVCDYTLLTEAVNEAKALGVNYHVGQLLSSDTFYSADDTQNERWRDAGILAVEMEAAALYMNAQYLKKRALAICTVSEHIFTGASLDSDARQTSFTDMMEVALGVAVKMAKM
jgi:purine-nucleoside phosphorylase